jgi:NitT/TauT family transport system substrate-binding protein
MRHCPRWLPLVGMLALLLGACSLTQAPPPPLRIGANIWPGFAPLYAAADRQLYGSTQVTMTTFSSLYDADRAFSQGRIDVLGTTLFDALRIADEGVALRVVLVIDYSNGADGVVASQGITSIPQLKGKRVAVEVGAINHFVLLSALDRAGLRESDVTLVNMSVEEAAKSLALGKIDAAALWEPLLSEQASAAGAQKLFTSAEIPGQIADVLVVRQDLAEQRPADVANLAIGWEQALQIWRTRPQEVEGVMAQSMNMTPDDLKANFGGLELVDLDHNRQLFDPANPQSLWKAYDATSAFMTQHQLLKQTAPAASAILDPRFVAPAPAR